MTGGIEPTDDDCDWPSDEEDEDAEKLSVSVAVSLKRNILGRVADSRASRMSRPVLVIVVIDRSPPHTKYARLSIKHNSGSDHVMQCSLDAGKRSCCLCSS